MSRCILKTNEIVNDNYLIIKSLGAGSYGNVYECFDMYKNKNVALKINKNGKRFEKSTKIEKYILLVLNDIIESSRCKKYIPEFYDSFYYDDYICFSMKLYSINLYKYIHKYYDDSTTYNINKITNIVEQMLQAGNFLSLNNVIHADIKPENFLFDLQHRNLVICDFGLSEICEKNDYLDFNYEIQSMWYRAPEAAVETYYNYKIDMWSIGTIIYEILFKKGMFVSKTNDKLLQLIFNFLGKPHDKLFKNDNKWNKLKYFRYDKLNAEYKLDTQFLYLKYNNVKKVDMLLKVIKKIIQWNEKDRYDYNILLKYF